MPKTIKMMLVRPLMTHLKITVRDKCTVSVYSPPPLLYIKVLAPLVAGEGGELAFGQMSVTFPYQMLASEIKQTFLSTNLACLVAFEW